MIDGSRQLGRTNLMLKAAVEAQREGKVIVIVGATQEHVKHLKHRYMQWGGNIQNVWFVAGRKWEDQVRGIDQDAVLFRDHFAVETFEAELRQKVIITQAKLDVATHKLSDIDKLLRG